MKNEQLKSAEEILSSIENSLHLSTFQLRKLDLLQLCKQIQLNAIKHGMTLAMQINLQGVHKHEYLYVANNRIK